MSYIKKIVLSLVLFLISFSAFAIESGLYTGSASAVHDDSYYYMNLIDWQKLNFDKFYGFTNFQGANDELNFAGASNLKNGDLLAYSYAGNFWTDGGYNSYNVFWGHNKLAVKGGLSFIDESTTTIDASLGFNATDKIGLTLSLSDGWNKDSETTEVMGIKSETNLSTNIFQLGIGGIYNIKETEKMLLRVSIGYTGYFYKNKVTTIINDGEPNVNSIENNRNRITLSGTFQYKINDRFSFGSVLTFPRISFFDNNGTEYTEMEFAMRNGFMASVVPNRLFISAGLSTQIPSLTFRKDQDTEKGTLTNNFYLGAAFDLTPQVRITSSTNIAITDGLSLEEAWQEVFNFSLQMKF